VSQPPEEPPERGYRDAAPPPPDAAPRAFRLKGLAVIEAAKEPLVLRLGCAYWIVPLAVVSVVLSDVSRVLGIVGAALCVTTIVQPILAMSLARRRAGPVPEVEVDREPVRLGERIEIRISGLVAIDAQRLDIDLECARGREIALVSGVPIDTDAGDGPARRWTVELPEHPEFRFAADRGTAERWRVLVRFTTRGKERKARYPLRVLARGGR
jgi:hypothetical protein